MQCRVPQKPIVTSSLKEKKKWTYDRSRTILSEHESLANAKIDFQVAFLDWYLTNSHCFVISKCAPASLFPWIRDNILNKAMRQLTRNPWEKLNNIYTGMIGEYEHPWTRICRFQIAALTYLSRTSDDWNNRQTVSYGCCRTSSHFGLPYVTQIVISWSYCLALCLLAPVNFNVQKNKLLFELFMAICKASLYKKRPHFFLGRAA